jgi:vacuolar protein-sorting-associated protein 4
MFELHVGNTTCDLTQKDYRELAEQTEGYAVSKPLLLLCLTFHSYSGSDIAIIVRDALMQPVRKVMSATHFKTVPSEGGNVKWTPCSPGDPAAVERTWAEVEGEELHEPPLRMADFVKSLSSVRPTVTQSDIKKHDAWTQESGTRFLGSFLVLYLITSQATMGLDDTHGLVSWGYLCITRIYDCA